MGKFFSSILISVIFLNFTGCATIVSGKTQDVMIRSVPSGAAVKINDIAMGITPYVANLERKKIHVIRLRKEGFAEESITTTQKWNGWFWANILLGGLIGIIVDPATGAMYKVEPEEINVTFSAAGQAPASVNVTMDEAIHAVQISETETPKTSLEDSLEFKKKHFD